MTDLTDLTHPVGVCDVVGCIYIAVRDPVKDKAVSTCAHPHDDGVFRYENGRVMSFTEAIGVAVQALYEYLATQSGTVYYNGVADPQFRR